MKRFLILLLPLALFAQQKARETPSAVWLDKPLPHWSCRPGLVPRQVALRQSATTAPLCIPQDRRMRYIESYDYDAQTEEIVSFRKELVIGDAGSAAFAWESYILRLPACLVTGNVTGQDGNRERYIYFGKPGERVHLDCLGAIKR
jgi:hypothetical protein